MAVNGDRAAVYIVEAEEELQTGGFATAGLSDNGGLGARGDSEAYAANGWFCLSLVGELDVVEFDFAEWGGKLDGVWLLNYP